MWGLLSRLIDLGVNGTCEAEQLLQVLLERRHGALGFENEEVSVLKSLSFLVRCYPALGCFAPWCSWPFANDFE